MAEDNKEILDDTFGKVIYDGLSFDKVDHETVVLFNEEYHLSLTIEDVYDEDLDDVIITDDQRASYKIYKDILIEEEDNMTQAIEEYALEFFDDFDLDEDIEDYLEPTTIYFNRTAQWGILFESKYDVENGIVLYFKDNETREIEVNTQDVFI